MPTADKAIPDDMIDRHLGENATVTVPLRTMVDLWFLGGDVIDTRLVYDWDGLEDALHEACTGAGFTDPIDALHRCGPGVLSTADGRMMMRIKGGDSK